MGETVLEYVVNASFPQASALQIQLAVVELFAHTLSIRQKQQAHLFRYLRGKTRLGNAPTTQCRILICLLFPGDFGRWSPMVWSPLENRLAFNMAMLHIKVLEISIAFRRAISQGKETTLVRTGCFEQQMGTDLRPSWTAPPPPPQPSLTLKSVIHLKGLTDSLNSDCRTGSLTARENIESSLGRCFSRYMSPQSPYFLTTGAP